MTKIAPVRVPRTTEAATALLERFAAIEAAIAANEGVRGVAISAANAAADTANAPLLAERHEIGHKLAVWWGKAGSALLKGKRKSVALGGCEIGSRAGRFSLAIAGDEEAIVKALGKRDWAEPLLRTRVTLDKAAVLASVTGVYGKQLAKLGLTRAGGEEQFFIKITGQAGTLAGQQSEG